MKKNTPYTLGLDLGTHSIGWALLDEHQRLQDGGVRIIRSERDETEDTKKTAARRAARSARRQYRRTRQRKNNLIKLLQRHDLFPACDLTSLQDHFKQSLSEDLQDFFEINPYELRSRALKKELSLHHIGRLLYHLAQRRGFPTESFIDKKDEEKGAMHNPKKVAEGMHTLPQTEELLQGDSTLGHALYELDKSYLGKNPSGLHRNRPSLRRRYTARHWYKKEFEQIWHHQVEYHPTQLTDDLKEKVHHILFHQRPLKNQKKTIGYCTLEGTKGSKPRRRRAAKHSLLFEEFRFYKTLNNLRIDEKPLTQDQRNDLIKKYKQRATDVSYKDIAKYLRLEKPEQLNLYKAGEKNNALPVCQIAHHLSKIFGKESLEQLTDEQKNTHINLMQNLDKQISRTQQAEKTAFLTRYAEKIHEGYYTQGKGPKDAKRTPEAIEKEIKTLYRKIKEGGYARYSTQVLHAALPYLQAGYGEHIAIPLASLEKVFHHAGKPWNAWKDDHKPIAPDQEAQTAQQTLIQKASHIISQAQEGQQTHALATWLQDKCKISKESTKLLYHHSQKEQPPLLKAGQKLSHRLLDHIRTNPVVKRTLTELRILLNTLISTHGLPKTIRIETARELKKSQEEKKKLALRNRKNEEKNNAAKALIARANEIVKDKEIPFTTRNITKARLYLETNGRSVYPIPGQDNENINLEDLFNGTWDVDHIVPKSISYDSSYINLTLCPRDLNQQEKINQTPYQVYRKDPATWEVVKDRAKRYFSYRKYRHFINEEKPSTDTFLNSQLTDTAYISQEARHLCSHLTHDTSSVKGGITSLLRHQWRLHTLPDLPAQLKDGTQLQDDTYYFALDENNQIVDYKKSTPDDLLPELSPTEQYNRRWKTLHQELKNSKGGYGRVVWGEVKDHQLEISKKANNIEHRIVHTPHLADGFYLLLIDTHNDNELLDHRAYPLELKNQEAKEDYQEKKKRYEDAIKRIKKELARKKGVGEGTYKVLQGEVYKERIHFGKDRTDHRHHLIDAIVIAHAHSGHIQQCNTESAQGMGYEELKKIDIPLPYQTLPQDTQDLLERTLIALRQKNRCYQQRASLSSKKGKQVHPAVRGPLHEETLYGKYKEDHSQDPARPYHTRISIEQLTRKKLSYIIDKQVRESVTAWFNAGQPEKPPYQKDNDNPIPIKKVTLSTNENLTQIQPHAWAPLGNNYMIALYQDTQGKWLGKTISFKEAVTIKQQGKFEVPPHKDAKLLFTLRANDYCVLDLTPAQVDAIHWEEPSKEDHRLIYKHLYRVQKFDVNGTIMFRKHCAATLEHAYEKIQKQPSALKKLNPVKIRLNALGHICKKVFSWNE